MISIMWGNMTTHNDNPAQLAFNFQPLAKREKRGDGCKGIATAAGDISRSTGSAADDLELEPRPVRIPAAADQSNAVLRWIKAPRVREFCERVSVSRRTARDAECDGGQVRATPEGALCLWHYCQLPRCGACGLPGSTIEGGAVHCAECYNEDWTPTYEPHAAGVLSRAPELAESAGFSKVEIGKVDQWMKDHKLRGEDWHTGNMSFIVANRLQQSDKKS